MEHKKKKKNATFSTLSHFWLRRLQITYNYARGWPAHVRGVFVVRKICATVLYIIYTGSAQCVREQQDTRGGCLLFSEGWTVPPRTPMRGRCRHAARDDPSTRREKNHARTHAHTHARAHEHSSCSGTRTRAIRVATLFGPVISLFHSRALFAPRRLQIFRRRNSHIRNSSVSALSAAYTCIYIYIRKLRRRTDEVLRTSYAHRQLLRAICFSIIIAPRQGPSGGSPAAAMINASGNNQQR